MLSQDPTTRNNAATRGVSVSNRSRRVNNSSRVKVAIRCRPAFQDEIDFAKGEFFPIVETKSEEIISDGLKLGQVGLVTMTGKTRDFYFDYVFGEQTQQDQVYDRLARPIVNDVLNGCNGTIFAYGQTGTGKTYTMGILEFIHNEHAGLIPRATAQIFEYIESRQASGGYDATISMSFLQLYRETIQDLLTSGSSPSSASTEENLVIREDPVRGFYVEGLQEFVVRSYPEAEALINLGLENRAIAPTLMNSTSSRSHTVLTINIEQVISAEGTSSYSRTLRSKLLMVDLAGSERVRRTISQGTRLSEAKSINTSLSALGNVIAALAEQNAGHIPYRDSKLTRLLQDSLGGTASTALIATIGPAPVNFGETLSTLLFAQRCMAVKITPIPHEEVDYAEMCAKLQAQVNELQGSLTQKLLEQQEMYESNIQDLREELEHERSRAMQSEISSVSRNASSGAYGVDFNEELRVVLDTVERQRSSDSAKLESSWFNKPHEWSDGASEDKKRKLPHGPLVSVLAYSFELINFLSQELNNILAANSLREEREQEAFATSFALESENEKFREKEVSSMSLEDPRNKGRKPEEVTKIGSHLAPMSKLEALTRVESQFRSNNSPLSQSDGVLIGANRSPPFENAKTLPSVYNYSSLEHLTMSLTNIRSRMSDDILSVNTLLTRKDFHYKNVKKELTVQMVERRKREEEVVNWSYILKYLLAQSSKLRRDLQQEKKVQIASSSSLSQSPVLTHIRAPHQSRSDMDAASVGREDSASRASSTGRLRGVDNPSESNPNTHHPSPTSSRFTSTLSAKAAQRAPASAATNSSEYQETLNRVRIRAQVANESLAANNIRQQVHVPQSASTKLFQPSPLQQHPPSRFDDYSDEDNDGYRSPGDALSELSYPSTARSYQSNLTPISYQRSTSSPKKGIKKSSGSHFAQEVVKNLGVQGDQALAAMSVIDRVASITNEQLQALDAETRDQIIQIRKDLGMDLFVPSVQARKQTAEEKHIERSRAISASRARASGGGGVVEPPRSRTTTPTLRQASEMQTFTSATATGGPSSSAQQHRQKAPQKSPGRSAYGPGAYPPQPPPVPPYADYNARTYASEAGSLRTGPSFIYKQPNKGFVDYDDDDNFSQLDFMDS